ncbi:MAG: 3-phosphoserine/phosphohydroxythreonine transaminase [Candidatus Margulisbacteria bacterium]|nr:3-phosphoserine/phosphohydroxythreonine transaminase [Candidatus Margulisiibacteriota bacterium]
MFNFNAGPAVMPEAVLEKAQKEMLNWRHSGQSVMELSHRSSEFESIRNHAENRVRSVMGVPDHYDVLFLQGGASLQFSMIPMNLYQPGKPMDVINTGSWTQKAIVEMKKIGKCHEVASTKKENFMRLPSQDELNFSKDSSFVYLASNNTIFGTQWPEFPIVKDNILVADMSSDILSRVIDVNQFDLIFAGAQKNIGPSGVTLVIIRHDLVDRGPENIPSVLQYRVHSKNRSLYNTPPTFGIYMMGLVLDWIHDQGGIIGMEAKNNEKAALLYDAIDKSDLFYGPVHHKNRSKMNVIFRVKDNHVELEEAFVKYATEAGQCGLKGHRSVGGLRASIYNAQPLVGVKALIDSMKKFESKIRI